MNVDPLPVGQDAPSFYSARGSFHLSLGDVKAARAHHRAAAAALLDETKACGHDRARLHLLRFQAATQLFKAGDYRRARELAGDVYAELLPGNIHHVFEQFKRDAAERSRPAYAGGVSQALQDCYPAGDWKRAIELLAEHPYVIAPPGMAYMRGVSLENLGKFRLAARWFGQAMADPFLVPGVLSAATVPDRLVAAGRWEEAETYVRAMADAVPHPFVLGSASYICYRCIRRPGIDHPTRIRYIQDQLQFLQRIGTASFSLPAGNPDFDAFTGYFAVFLVAAAETMFNANRPEQAELILADAIRLDPEFGERAGRELRQQEAAGTHRASPENQEVQVKDVQLPEWAIERAKSLNPRAAKGGREWWGAARPQGENEQQVFLSHSF